MDDLKDRRLRQLKLSSHTDLYVGQCVPFYFCPRSIMLYMLWRRNHNELTYRCGQDPIVHLEFDLYDAVRWADAHDRRWAFTLSNASAYSSEDRCNLKHLDEINWHAVHADNWSGLKHGKQAEFLVESSIPWRLVERIGVATQATHTQANHALHASSHNPKLEVKPDWCY